MVNAVRLAGDFIQALPRDISPERTEKREGFVHPIEIRGGAEEVEIRMLLRDFEPEGLEAKRALVQAAARENPARRSRGRGWRWIFRRVYRNMRYWLEKGFPPG